MNQLSDWNELIDKKVNIFEMIEIGKIISIDSYSVTIKSASGKSMSFLNIGLEAMTKK